MAIHFDTQWPSPSGFHVPLNTEWQAVRDIRVALGGWSSAWTNFWIALKLPFAGGRNYSSAGVENQGSYGLYWSSSRYDTNNAYRLSFRSTALYPQNNNYRAYGFSVRCFKDTPTVPTSSWTKLYWTSVEAGWIFWSSTDWLISLSSDWNTWITMADKNLWATTVWNSWDTLSEANCGYYYQRWNNYGFPRTWGVTTSSTQVDASTYWPWNYYSSSTFITRSSSPYSWDSTDNWNLWWWVSQWTWETPDPIRLHWAIQTFHFKPELMEPADLIALVTTDIFWGINFSGMINELNKYPQIYYGKNSADNNLYTLYNVANTLWNWEWSAYYVTTTHPKTWRNMDTFVAYNATTGTRGWYTYWWWEIEPF